jgi:hypothetical protein
VYEHSYLTFSTLFSLMVLFFSADPDPAFHVDAGPDPAFPVSADPDPDPAFHVSADPDPDPDPAALSR